MWNIIVDSGCDLTGLEIKREDAVFRRVPLKIQVEDYTFTDDIGADIMEMMDKMRAFKGRSYTSCPNPADYYAAYESADMNIVFTITGSMSGSYNSACAAKDMISETYPDKKVFIFDSLSTGPEMTLLVHKTVECIENGMSYEDTCSAITEYSKKTHLQFILSGLDNFVKNGRVSKLVAATVGVLGIRIAGKASEAGELEITAKCRGYKKAVAETIKEMNRNGYTDGKVIIAHSFNEEEAIIIRDELIKVYGINEITIMETSGLCSYYMDFGGILIGYEA